MGEVAAASRRAETEDLSITPEALEVFYFEAPLKQPRKNAFGAMNVRPALIVRMRDASGAQGLGEVFCNWPVFGGHHRARIVSDLLAPLVLGRRYRSPLHLFDALVAATNAIKVQCDESGPFDQAIAGLDIAAWDCVARRRGLALHALLAVDSSRRATPLLVYASALTAERLDTLVPRLRDAGVQGFKLKVGFGLEDDLRALARLREVVGRQATVMIGANQRWTLPHAREAAAALSVHDVAWLEEPLPATARLESWRALSRQSPVPLAAGENIRGLKRFIEFLSSGVLSFVQPDPIKWGGLSYFAPIAAMARKTGARLCPHYLGGAVGLLATGHALSAVGADWFELDVTENPLREALVQPSPRLEEGRLTLPNGSGLGVELDLERCQQFLVFSRATKALMADTQYPDEPRPPTANVSRHQDRQR